MKTLRARLLLFTTVATASVLIAAGLSVYLVNRASLYAQFDAGLVDSSRALQSATELRPRGVRLDLDITQFPEYSRKNSPDFFQIWLDDGNVLARSPSLEGLSAQLTPPASPSSTPVISDVTLPDGRIGRQLTLAYGARIEPNTRVRPSMKPRSATLVVARHTGALEGNLRGLRWILGVVGLIATAVTSLTLYAAVFRGLRPLGKLADRIKGIGQQDLLNPIELPNLPGELSVVVQRLNELLGRLHEAIVRERSFTADVSHELRTPLAGLEVTLEIASLKLRRPEDYESRIQKSLSIVRELRSMVDNLLMLARADAGQLVVNETDVNLAHFVESCWSHFQDAADDRGLTTALELEPVLARTDTDKLRIILHNLMDNAVAYCDPGGQISLSLGRRDDAVEFRVANPARSITPEQITKVFDRFWRADSSRSDTGVHCGLGLSLSQKIAPLVGATLDVKVTPDHLFEVRLRLPASPIIGKEPHAVPRAREIAEVQI